MVFGHKINVYVCVCVRSADVRERTWVEEALGKREIDTEYVRSAHGTVARWTNLIFPVTYTYKLDTLAPVGVSTLHICTAGLPCAGYTSHISGQSTGWHLKSIKLKKNIFNFTVFFLCDFQVWNENLADWVYYICIIRCSVET